ncbi:glycerophosphodiester phosphodiesterase family protein [Loigolactobacillus backii]|uniref:Uncharacterized protein n=1 Tax=Loigolactobacillus backii TaxID=375175 RepID=A0A192H3B7_9LACO|nr:glycerophosphodiester phosphodiesterase family protein [Loigolactobacillus backii]ANK59338.1 hypothetical protein AYR52_03195 [Loigolactobacillus backii]ANK62753.1 hypothetical protein AYR53_08325 [Loigolactobacillus backii]ANK64330.1 hypothetical protein AYR54_03195 [Loigolactobacillus backii]ANK67274.1 hypothetical protein AYR55_05840 [Loigolactobacillus backii]ANK70239.1 hypothetical protein AYR56_08680 [Loigolactobacillus backii]
MTLIFGHRGSKGSCPENTLVSFRQAIVDGADGIETDVQCSGDGALIIMHDEKVNRTTNGRGAIKQLSLEKLKALDAGSWFAPQFAGERIPTLQEVLNLLDQQHFTGVFNLEIKTDHTDYPGIEQKVIQAMTQNKHTYQVLYSSFNLTSLAQLKFYAPNAHLASLFKYSSRQTRKLTKAGTVVAWHPKLAWVKRHLKTIPAELAVRPWTVNSVPDLKYCFQANFAGLFTDYPKEALAIREQECGRNA